MRTSHSLFASAAAVTFAAGIALAGPGLRAPVDGRSRKELDGARSPDPGTPRTARPPADPTQALPALARALTQDPPDEPPGS